MAMFSGCSNLTSIPGIESWDTGNVENMDEMFLWIPAVLDLRSWNVCKLSYEPDKFNLGSDNITSPYFGDPTKCNGGLPA